MGSNATITPVSHAFAADAGARTITGRIIEYGVTMKGTIKTTFSPQALVLPSDVKRVKLFRDHRNQYGIGTPVGWMTHIENRPDGAYATFAIGVGPDGDQALHDAQGVRDGFSVEVADLQMSADRRTVTRALLEAVALVPMPAAHEARVQSVQFHSNPIQEENRMTEQQQTVDPQATATAVAEALTTDPAPEDQVPRSQPTYTPGATPATEPVQLPADASFAGTASAPTNALTGIAKRGPSFHEVADYLGSMMRGEAPQASFALADITHTAFSPNVSQAGWLGELWDGIGYTREIIPLFTQRTLTHYEMTGWRWTTKPQVAKYAGDKTEIPTNTPAVGPAKIEAQRWAGGWDLDRKFIDFNDREFVASFLRAAAEDYGFKTDQDAATWAVANATAVAGAAPDLLRAAARGAQAVRRGRAGAASFVIVNDADLESLLDFTGLDVPAFLKTLGIAPENWTPSELVPSGTVLVGAKRAVEYYELGGSPIRVSALDLARAGVDHALYGYDAKHVVNPAGLVKLTVTPPAAG